MWTCYRSAVGIPFTPNPRLVRGLDYYTRSVWEIWPPTGGAQSTLGGGGRYDGLAEQLGGKPTPAVGFATGIERIILTLKEQRVQVPPAPSLRVYLVYQNVAGKAQAFHLAETLRSQGVAVDLAFGDRKLGKQLAAANRSGAQFAVIFGEEEIAQGAVALKDLRDGGEQRRVSLSELSVVLAGGKVLV
jgi:histidyl-tRNA synthetase